MSTYASINGMESSPPWVAAACRSRAIFRSAMYGEMKDVMAIVEESANSLATWYQPCQLIFPFKNWRETPTSAILLMFSFRSFSEKPKSLFSPNRTLSPSKRYAANPRCRRCCSRAVATVDFPDADKPVSHIVNPRCFRNSLRSCLERDGCQVMFLQKKPVNFCRASAGLAGYLRRHSWPWFLNATFQCFPETSQYLYNRYLSLGQLSHQLKVGSGQLSRVNNSGAKESSASLALSGSRAV